MAPGQSCSVGSLPSLDERFKELDDLSRRRPLTDQESLRLERLIRAIDARRRKKGRAR